MPLNFLSRFDLVSVDVGADGCANHWLQVLDALANKRLVEKRIRTDRNRGKVVSFEPLKGQLPESWGSA